VIVARQFPGHFVSERDPLPRRHLRLDSPSSGRSEKKVRIKFLVRRLPCKTNSTQNCSASSLTLKLMKDKSTDALILKLHDNPTNYHQTFTSCPADSMPVNSITATSFKPTRGTCSFVISGLSIQYGVMIPSGLSWAQDS
jgi:hypothetical protein